MPSQYNWNRRWILPGTREDQETNLSALAQRWFSVSRQSTTNSFALDDLANIPVIILLGEPGIGKSSEIAFYFHRSSEVIAQHIWKLQEYPPIDFNRFFNQPHFQKWRDGQSNLILFIDSFDEGVHPPITLGRDLVEALEASPARLEKLYLRIACRTADWSEDTTRRLRNLFGEENLLTVELDALGQQEVVEAATSHGINAFQFLEQIEQNALAALTLKPITLADLLKEYLTNRSVLPDTRNALYESMCRRLCEEHNKYHDENDRRGNFTLDEIFTEAARLATIMLTTRRLAVWMPSSTREIPDGSIAIGELRHGSSAEDRLTIATLHTGFFSSRGPNQLGWAHLSYAEYLAAFYMHTNMSLPQIRSLMVHPDGNKIIPQLREVAAWITTMNPTLLQFVADLDPEALFQSDLIVEDTDAREALTTMFLDLYHQEILIEIPFNSQAPYRRLIHPTLAEQLSSFAHDGSRNERSRYVAISIIHACELQVAADSLVNLVLDTDLEYRLRAHAAYVVARIGSSTAKLALKPLIAGGASDIDDELKGAGLIATWPEHLTTLELFEALTPRKKENFAGAYSVFLRAEIIDDIPENDLPIALKWAANFIERYTDTHHHIDLTIQDLIDEIVYKSWVHFDILGVPDAFARLVLAKVTQFHPLFGTQRRQQLADRYQQVMDEFLQNEQKRRQILLSAINLVTNPDFNYFVLNYDISLVLDTDLPWLIELLQTNSHLIARNTLLQLIGTVFRRWNPYHMDTMALAMEHTEALRDLFGKWFYVCLDSEYADDLRQAHRREQEREAKYQEIETRRKEQLIDPPPLFRLEEVLDQCERGETKEWWRTNIWLAANEYGNFNDWYGDIRQMPNWEHLKRSTRERLLSLGIDYVFNAPSETKEWFGRYAFWRPAVAAYRMLFLLHDLGLELPVQIWQKWIPAIIAFPSHFVRSEHEKHWQFVAAAYQNDGECLRYYLQEFLTYLHNPNNDISIIENYLHRFTSCFDGELAHILLAYLDDPNIKPEHYGGTLNFLLQKRVPGACSRAATDFQTLHGRYQLMMMHIVVLANLQMVKQSFKLIVAKVIQATFGDAYKCRDEAVRLAANLIASPVHGDWWNTIWTITQNDEEFGRRIIETTSGIHDDRRIAIIGSQILEKDTANLYLWITERYPHQEDPELDGWVSPRHTVADWRDSLLTQLAERGTFEALTELDRIAAAYPDLYQPKRLRKYLIEHLYKKTWHPPQASDVLSLLRDNEQRFVQTDNQLLDVVIESLDRLQRRLQGETYSAVDLWNVIPNEAICRPKDENALSNYIKRHLEQDLKERGIIVNREVEIRQKEGGEGAAAGEIPDLYVSAVSQSLDHNKMNQLVVLIEVKGNWHSELKTAAQTQLVERYLRDNDRATCGLYLVGWFNCQQWDENDYRRNTAMNNDYVSLCNELETQATTLSNSVLDVRVYILDISLRDTSL